MKRRLLEIVLVLVVAALAFSIASCKSELPENAVAKVGDIYITVEQLDAEVAKEAAAYGITPEAYPDSYEQYYKSLSKDVLQNLVLNELADQEAAKLGLSVTDAEVQTELDGYVSSYYAGDQAALAEALTAEGYTLDDFKTNVKDGLLRSKVKDEVTKDFTSVPAEQVTAYYEANKTSYYVEPSREIRHILIVAGATSTASTTTTQGSGTTAAPATAAVTEADWAKALNTAKEVRRKLVSGGDWAKLASEYSDDFATKDKGGVMGLITQGQTTKAFEDAAFALGLNEISQPVRTVYGYEIIQATAVTKGGQQTLDEVKSQIESQLLAETQNTAWSTWLEQRKAAAHVIYRDDLKPETTSTESTTTTTVPGPTTTAVSSVTSTTAKP